MKLIQHILACIALLAATGAAFAPSPVQRQTVVMNMGLFDGIKEYFSEEARAKREEEKQRMLEEQEAAYREVLERRRNPEKMDEYMEERKERLSKFMDKEE